MSVLVFLGIGGFLLVTAAGYWFTSYEDAGSVLLAAGGLFALWVGWALLAWSRGEEPGPEDRDVGPGEGAGPVGRFSSASLWPVLVALGGTILAQGLVGGMWLIAPGAALLAVAVVGYAYQHVPGAPRPPR